MEILDSNIPKSEFKRIVILGGGFAGIAFARKLSKSPYQVVLLDRNNYHQFQPLLYQVSTSALEANAISFPFRKIFQGNKNTIVRLCSVEEINSSENYVKTDIGNISFDFLVIAIGTTNNFFGNQHIADRSFSMKSVPEALLIRNTLLEHLEKAVLTQEEEERKALLTIVIVGGGPTGTEIAGTLGDMKMHVFPKDYPEINFSEMKIHLVEGSPHVLNSMSQVSKVKAETYLKELDIEVHVNTVVKDYDGKTVFLGDNTTIRSEMLIWAAGVTGNKLKGIDSTSLVKGNRILVDEFLQLKSYPHIFAIGDIAAMPTEDFPFGHPQLAAVASQQGALLAENFKRMIKNRPQKPFVFSNKGVMATVGRNKAVVELPFLKFQGFFAWLVWMFVHLILTLGVKNKLMIFINWTWSYFTLDQSLRLIIRPKAMSTLEEKIIVKPA